MTKFNINFSPHVYRLVGEMALEREQAMADVIRDSISLAAWLDDELRQKHKVLVERDGKVTELLLPHAGRLQPKRPTLPLPDLEGEELEPSARSRAAAQSARAVATAKVSSAVDRHELKAARSAAGPLNVSPRGAH